MTAVAPTSTQGGTVSLSGGNITYAPPANYSGADSFTYTVTDNGTTNGVPDPKSASGTVNVTVTEVNDAPATAPDARSTAEDAPLVFAASTLTTNDTTGPANESTQTLTVTAVSGTSTQGGTVSLSGGNVNYTPPANYFGADSFTYTVTDNGTTNGSPDPKSASGTVNVTVTEVNDAPATAADAKSTAEDAPLVFAASTLTTNDTTGPANESAQTLTVTAVSGTSTQGGTVSLSGGNITYAPPANYFGADGFTYTVTDNGTTNGSPDPKSASGTVNVTVTEVNDAPAATADATSTAEDTALTFAASTLTTNDSAGANESAQTLTVTAVSATSTQGGTVSLSGGNITYTPPANYFGSDSFTYTVTDNGTTNGVPDAKSAAGTVNVMVSEVNDAPTAASDPESTAEDVPLAFAASSLTTNDSAGPANESTQSLIVTAVSSTSTQGGAVTLIGGSITYTPPANFFGGDSFTYIVTDNGTTNGAPDAKSASGTVNVTVTEVNDAPAATPDAKSTLEDIPLIFASSALTTNDSAGPANESAQTLNVTSVSATSTHGGTVALSAGNITYTPPANYFGADSFTYTVTDNGTTNGAPDAKSSVGTVNVTVSEVNDPPAAVSDAQSTAEDIPLVFAALTLTANDSAGPANESSQTLTVTAVASSSVHGGTVTLSGPDITYTPPPNYFGPDSFSYTVTDNGTTSGTPDPQSAAATVNVMVTEVNDAPAAASDAQSTPENTPLTLAASALTTNDSAGPSNESTQLLTVTAVSSTSAHGGTVVLSAGQITYTPPASYNGNDTFTYTVTDDGTTNGSPDPKSATGTVTVTVGEANDVPVANEDSRTAVEDTPLAFAASTLTENDSPGPPNESGQTLMVTAVSATSAQGGTVVLSGGNITYTPPANYAGADSFTYTVTDDGMTGGSPDPQTAIGTVSVTVSEVNDAPTATTDAKSTAEDVPLMFAASTLTANDSSGPANESEQTLTVTAVSPTSAQGGMVTLSGGNIIYTPPPDYFGADSFTYTGTDNGTTGGAPDPRSVTGTVIVTVSEVNDAPAAASDARNTTEGTQLMFAASTLTANDSAGPANESAQVLIVTAVSATSTHGGSVVLSGGNITYTPLAGFDGTDTFTYVVTDNGTTNGIADAKSASGTVTVTVANVPVADLVVTKTSATTVAQPGDAIAYTITVTNNGPDQASNVVVTDDLPAGLHFVSATPSQGSCSGTNHLLCNLGVMNSGSGATITLQTLVSATSGAVSNTAAVSSDTTDTDPANNSAVSAATTVNPATPIPALSDWLLILLGGALAFAGMLRMR